MKGLEISEIKLSELQNERTIGAEYYSPRYRDPDLELRSAQFELPTLRESCSKITDGDHGSAEYDDSGVPFILSEAVEEGWINSGSCRFITPEYAAKLSRSELRAGDVLVTKTGVYFGKSAVVPSSFDGANTIAHVGILRPKKGLNPWYLSTFLNSSYGQAQLRRRGIKATRPEIKLIEFQDIVVPKVSVDFQRLVEKRVKAALRYLDKSKDLLRKTELSLLEELQLADLNLPQESIYDCHSSSVVAAERFDAEYFHPAKAYAIKRLSQLPGQPLSERVQSVRLIFDPKKTHEPFRVRNFDLPDALHPVLTDSKPESWSSDVGSAKKFFENGDVVISRLRYYLREIAIVRTTGQAQAIGSTEFIVLRPPETGITAESLWAFLRCEPVQTILQWCRDGALHPRFSEKDLLSIPVPDAVLGAAAKIDRIFQSAMEAHRRGVQMFDEAKSSVEIAIKQSEAAGLAQLKD